MNIPIFYAPLLHRTLAPAVVPLNVAFFPAGLPEGKRSRAREAASEPLAAETAVREALPLKSAEAASVLAEMLRMGEEFAPDGLLRQIAAHQFMQDQRDASGGPGEFADLEAFVAAKAPAEPGGRVQVPNWGTEPGRDQAALLAATRKALVDCQKILLLAHSREERLLELLRLEERYREAESALAAALGEPDEHDWRSLAGDDDPDDAGQADESAPLSPVPWRVMLDAALPFLPDKAVLFTADTAMALDLREAGMLQPFPEDRAVLCEGWPQELVTGLLYAGLPAWRLVGRRKPQAERPWLDREVEVFVARPPSGWLEAAESYGGAAAKGGQA